MARSGILVLDPRDNVGVALSYLEPGTLARTNSGGEGERIAVGEGIPALHKVALCDIPEHGPVLKYGHTIGRATRPIRLGMHVHTHNLVDDYGLS